MTTGECPFCERRCRLDEGDSRISRTGFCKMYHLVNGHVAERFPNRYSSLFISHIEAVPFYHFQPGSRTLVLGGAGCNLDCHYCSNAHVARSEPEPLLIHHLTPQRVIALSRQNGCHNIAFAVNEPTVACPSLLELAHVAQEEGFPFGVLTNGYMQPDIAARMGEAFAFVNVSLKSISDSFYQKFAGVPSAESVMANIGILRQKTHLEISTPIVQGLNDQDIPLITSFIASIDPQIPWHVFRLLPEYKMAGYDRPAIEEVNEALEAARQQLPYIYFGNFVGSHWVSTLCPQCNSVAVERINLGGCGAKALSYNLRDGRCATCGYALPIAGSPVAWNSNEVIA